MRQPSVSEAEALAEPRGASRVKRGGGVSEVALAGRKRGGASEPTRGET